MDNATNRTMWWAMAGSLVVYAVAALALVPVETTEPGEGLAPVLVGAFGLISVGTAVGSILYRRRALVEPIRTGALDLSTPTGVQKAFQPYVLNLVLSESIGIYGLVLAFLFGRGVLCLPFVAGALAMLYLHRPTAPGLTPPLSDERRAIDSTPIT